MYLNKKNWLVILPLGVLVFIALYAFPLFIQLFNKTLYKNLFNLDVNSWILPLFRTLIFSTIAVLIQVFGGFYLSLRLLKSGKNISRIFSFLLVPVLLGGVAVGFIFKVGIINDNFLSHSIADRDSIPTWGVMLAIQTWQYVPLFAYMFWLRLNNIRENFTSFAQVSHLNESELVRDIYWPECRDIASLLALYSVVECYHEFIKFHLILRASAGTGTELVSHWLLRYYNYYSPVDPRIAMSNTLAMSLLFTGIGLLFSAIFIFILHKYSINIIRVLSRPIAFASEKKHTCIIFSIGLFTICFFPFTTLVPYLFRVSFIDTHGFFRSCFLTGLVVSVVMGVTISFGFILRVVWPKLLNKFSKRSLPVLSGLYLLHLVPPIGVALSGYYWISALNLNLRNELYSIVIWFIGQIILVFPILSIFVLLNHFRIRNEELNFQKSSQTRLRELFHFSFYKRMRLEYVLISLFGFSFVWSESILNSIMSNLSRNIPSIAVELTQRIDGRGGSYYEAANLIMVVLVPVILGILIWGYLIKSRGMINRRI